MKQYGIRITLPAGDTMRAPHLLGDRFESYRWFTNEEARNRAMAEMRTKLAYYRRADFVTQELEKTERMVESTYSVK